MCIAPPPVPSATMVLRLIILLVLLLLVLLQVLPSRAEVVVLPFLPARALLRAGHLCLHVEVARESGGSTRSCRACWPAPAPHRLCLQP